MRRKGTNLLYMCAGFALKTEKKKERNGNMENLNNYWIMVMDELGSIPSTFDVVWNIHNKNVVDGGFSSLRAVELRPSVSHWLWAGGLPQLLTMWAFPGTAGSHQNKNTKEDKMTASVYKPNLQSDHLFLLSSFSKGEWILGGGISGVILEAALHWY